MNASVLDIAFDLILWIESMCNDAFMYETLIDPSSSLDAIYMKMLQQADSYSAHRQCSNLSSLDMLIIDSTSSLGDFIVQPNPFPHPSSPRLHRLSEIFGQVLRRYSLLPGSSTTLGCSSKTANFRMRDVDSISETRQTNRGKTAHLVPTETRLS